MTKIKQPVAVLAGPHGLRLTLDPNEVFPDDPGAGTPAMVTLGRASATYWCACDVGHLTTPRGDEVALSSDQVDWLAELNEHVDRWLAERQTTSR